MARAMASEEEVEKAWAQLEAALEEKRAAAKMVKQTVEALAAVHVEGRQADVLARVAMKAVRWEASVEHILGRIPAGPSPSVRRTDRRARSCRKDRP